MDYLFYAAEVDENMTVLPGTVIGWAGWYGQPGLTVAPGVQIQFQGTPENPSLFVRSDAVLDLDQSPVGAGIASTATGNSAAVLANFAHFAIPLDGSVYFGAQTPSMIISVTNSEFCGGNISEDSIGLELFLFNCLLNNTTLTLGNYISPQMICSLTLTNCTLEGGSVFLDRANSQPLWPVNIANCAMDGTSLSFYDPYGGGKFPNMYFDHNGGQASFIGKNPGLGTAWVAVSSGLNWQSSWFGDFYLPSNSPLVNAGNTTADQLDFYNFTTQVNQVKEAFSIVDIGYHYVAVDANGKPIDSNQDGIPDYLEDGHPVQFAIGTTNNYVSSSSPCLEVDVTSGFPAYCATLVDDNNFGDAAWADYTASTLTVNLGPDQGSHDAWIGLCGLGANAPITWQETTFILDSGSPTISITAPANNSPCNTTRINVSGTFAEPCVKRITVNGVPAFVSGNTFEAMNVPLVQGANTITATLQNVAGSTATATIAVTANGTLVDPVQLQATPTTGFVPLAVTFQVTANVPGTIEQVFYDFEGAGSSDQTASDLTPLIHNYSSAGEYFPVVTVVTTAGNFSSSGGLNSADPIAWLSTPKCRPYCKTRLRSLIPWI